MKKKIKLGIIMMLILGVIIIPCNTNAASTEMTYIVSPTSDTNSNKINKTVVNAQKLKIRNAYTPITDPCPDCQVSFKPYREGYGGCDGMTVKMNQTKTFQEIHLCLKEHTILLYVEQM